MDSGNVKVLVVDDGEAQRLALAALLFEVGVEPVTAASGREALRHLLEQEFALILLDVNMPGLDGFETAALIRARRSNETTPIIFVTAYHDDAFTARGYSLGAVDYILAPVQPDVLRTKVSVFVELYRKTEQVRQQREALRRHAEQLRQLTQASLTLGAAATVEDVLQATVSSATTIIGAEQGGVSAALQDGKTMLRLVQLADKYEVDAVPQRFPATAPVFDLPHPVRLSAGELAHGPSVVPTPMVDGVPLHGWLAAPMTTRDGRVVGVVQVSEKRVGDFTVQDEGILVQLAQMAAVAIDNLWAAEAREANRLKDEFLGVLSHELRTPMQAMLTWISILRETTDRETLLRGLDAMQRSARAQTQLVEDLLDISRIIRGQLRIEPAPLDLRHVVGLAIDTIRSAAAKKSIDIVFDRPVEPAGTMGDAARLQQVVLNILSNAVNFTPERGRIRVELIAVDDQLELQIQDSGSGIPVAFLPYVFDRFRQADSTSARRHGGLGLGLSIVRHLVELHGGTVRAENGPGGGAVFIVHLPARAFGAVGATEELSPTSPIDALTNGHCLDGIQVVLVEDEPEARDAMTLALQSYGAQVVAVGSADAALDAIRQARPHVLLSDLGLPTVDGFTLMRQVRALDTPLDALPAVALTAYVRLEERVAAIAAGFNEHVQKPVEPLTLAHVVQHLAGRVRAS